MGNRYYTGIGSRKTPRFIQKIMNKIATMLENKGYILRTGDASGADKAFRNGILNETNVEVYTVNDVNNKCYELAKKYHPVYNKLQPYAKSLIARNSLQILGEDLNTPSDFVVCWTPDGAITDKERSTYTGGTGQVISIADDYNVPVLNLKNGATLLRVEEWLEKEGV